MRILSILAVSALVIIISLSGISDTQAKDKKKGVILSTVDIDEEYRILGLVSYRSNELNPKKMHDALRKKAKKMGADYVIGISYYSNAGYLYATGTAIKLIEEDEPDESKEQ